MRPQCYAKAFLLGLIILAKYADVQALSLTFNPVNQMVERHTSTTVDLLISGLGEHTAPSLSAFDLTVRFDPSLLTLNTADADMDGVIDSVVVDPSGQLDIQNLGGTLVAAGLTSPGLLNLSAVSLDAPSDLNTLQVGSFTLARITFTTSSGTGTSPLDIVHPVLGDATALPTGPLLLSADVRSGAITVVPEPSTWLLLASGIMGLAGYGWRSRQRRECSR